MEDETCILVTSSRMNISNQEQFDSVQEGARIIGDSLIEDLDNIFLVSTFSKLHSVFLQSGGQFLAGGD